MYFFHKNKYTILLILTTVIFVFSVAMGMSGEGKPGIIKEVVTSLTKPAQSCTTSASGSVGGFFNYLKNMKGYEKENQRLREYAANLEDKIRKTESLKAENDRLRKLLELKQSETEFDTVAADVVAFSADNFCRTYTINKGLKDGVSENCAVITPFGLVGYVTEVGRGWAKISPIVDPNVSISANIERLNNTAIVQGDMSLMDDGNCKMTYVSKELGLEIGDYVETSGSGGIIPAGIYIGKVTKIEDDVTGVSQEAIIKPGVDFSDIDEVLVIRQ